MTTAPVWDPSAIDRQIHEPVRLGIMTILADGYVADFVYLKNALTLSDGNLAAHLRSLEECGYVKCTKEFFGRKPRSQYVISEAGKTAYTQYVSTITRLLKRPDPPKPGAWGP